MLLLEVFLSKGIVYQVRMHAGTLFVLSIRHTVVLMFKARFRIVLRLIVVFCAANNRKYIFKHEAESSKIDLSIGVAYTCRQTVTVDNVDKT